MLRDELVCRVDTKCAKDKLLGYIEPILDSDLLTSWNSKTTFEGRTKIVIEN